MHHQEAIWCIQLLRLRWTMMMEALEFFPLMEGKAECWLVASTGAVGSFRGLRMTWGVDFIPALSTNGQSS